MGTGFLLGSFLAFAAVSCVVILYIRHRIRRFSKNVFGTEDFLDVLSGLETGEEATPRSLSGCDRLLLPQILRDFPDYDPAYAKTCVCDYLRDNLGKQKDFTVHNVVIHQYLTASVQRTIVYQAAVSWMEDTGRTQRRFDIHHTYLLPQSDISVAANCPNCGGALTLGETVCPYCDVRVVNILGNTWEFTDLKES